MPSWFIHSLGVYAAVCLVSLLFGSAILRLLRPGLSPTLCFCLAPVVTAAFWACLLSLGIRLGHSVRGTSIVVWGLTLAVAGAGALRKWGPRPRADRWLMAACLAAPVVAMATAFWQGLDVYTNSMFSDSWVYSALGRHAWKYHYRDQIRDGLRPLYAYAAGPRPDRIVGPALEGFLSHLYVPGEVQTGANLYTAHSLLMLCGATAAFGLSLGLRTWAVVTAVFLVACSHWIGNIVFLGSLDHLFGLAYLPACLVLSGGPSPLNWRSAILAGILLGAVAMAYPPGLLFVLGPAVVAWGWRVLREGCPYGVALGHAGLALLTFIVFLNAEIRVLAFETQVQFQAAMASSANRPGGMVLSGMLKSGLPAFLGMGSEWGPEWGTYVPPRWAAGLQQALAVVVCIALLMGFWHLTRVGRPDLTFSAALLVSGSVYFLLKERYPYGAMKMLTFIWPILLVAVVVAAALALRLRGRALGVGLAAASLLSVAWCESPWWVPKAYPMAAIPSHSYREYHLLKERLHALTGGAPIALGVQNVVTYLWLEYFLCDEPIQTLPPANPLPILVPLVADWPNIVRPTLQETHHLITDGPKPPAGVGGSWMRVYESESFSLWKECGGGGSPVQAANPCPRAAAHGAS